MADPEGQLTLEIKVRKDQGFQKLIIPPVWRKYILFEFHLFKLGTAGSETLEAGQWNAVAWSQASDRKQTGCIPGVPLNLPPRSMLEDPAD